MAKVAANFCEHPADKFDVIGVTGTNGKTSITTFINEILRNCNKKVGLIGTIKIFDGDMRFHQIQLLLRVLIYRRYSREWLIMDVIVVQWRFHLIR